MRNCCALSKLLIGVMLLACPVLVTSPAFAQAEWARLENHKVTLGEPVLLRIHLENTGSQDTEVDLGGDSEQNILLEVIAPNGGLQTKPEVQLKDGPTFFGIVRLRPGETFSMSLLLNKWFKFDQIGAYNLRVKLRTTRANNDVTAAMLPRALTLDMVARDPRRLEAVCGALLTRSRRYGLAQEAYVAAQALSTIQDPVAIPFLEQGAKHSIHAGVFIKGLANINSREAIMAIISAMQSDNSEAREYARNELRNVAARSQDTSLQELARRALAAKSEK